MANASEKKVVEFMLPEGRLINASLFKKDQFDEKSVPAYKAEVAYDPADLNPIIERMVKEIEEHFGPDHPAVKGGVLLDIDAGPDDENYIITPFLNGDTLAKKREKRNKPGDAYKGKTVIRMNTIYNHEGQDAPGGVYVCDEAAEQVLAVNASKVYNGCYVQVYVTVKWWEDEDTGNDAFKFYLKAVQKTKDGEKLSSTADHSTLFKPVGRSGGDAGGDAKGGGRRGSRKG